MTPPPQQTGSRDALYANLYDWLLGEGYPLELRVARALGRCGWQFVLGARYRDALKQDSIREVDLLATRRQWLLNRRALEASAEVTLVIECKTSKKSKPWVVFAIDEADDELAMNMSDDVPYDYDLLPIGDLSRSALAVTPLHQQPGFERLHVWLKRPASSVVQAFRDSEGADSSYSAVLSALGAALSIARTGADAHDAHRFEYCVPVVITDAPVFRFSVNADGSDHLEEVGYASVLAEHPGSVGPEASQSGHAVHIVPFGSLDDFLACMTRDADALIGSLVGSRAAYTKLQRHLSKRPRLGA